MQVTRLSAMRGPISDCGAPGNIEGLTVYPAATVIRRRIPGRVAYDPLATQPGETDPAAARRCSNTMDTSVGSTGSISPTCGQTRRERSLRARCVARVSTSRHIRSRPRCARSHRERPTVAAQPHIPRLVPGLADASFWVQSILAGIAGLGLDPDIERIQGLPLDQQAAAWGALDQTIEDDAYPIITTAYGGVAATARLQDRRTTPQRGVWGDTDLGGHLCQHPQLTHFSCDAVCSAGDGRREIGGRYSQRPDCLGFPSGGVPPCSLLDGMCGSPCLVRRCGPRGVHRARPLCRHPGVDDGPPRRLCGPGPDSHRPGPGHRRRSQRRRGHDPCSARGWLQQGPYPDVHTLDPSEVYGTIESAVLSDLITRSLTQYVWDDDAGGLVLVPDLATDLGTPNADYTEWTFTIRDGVRFEDGTPVTADDVAYGIKRSMDDKKFPFDPSWGHEFFLHGDTYGGLYTSGSSYDAHRRRRQPADHQDVASPSPTCRTTATSQRWARYRRRTATPPSTTAIRWRPARTRSRTYASARRSPWSATRNGTRIPIRAGISTSTSSTSGSASPTEPTLDALIADRDERRPPSPSTGCRPNACSRATPPPTG